MREIKFRAWDFAEKKMITKSTPNGREAWDYMDDTATIISMVSALSKDEDFSLMQYTGLKDKNGKPIYEGDVVAVTDGQVWSVEFQDGAFQVFNHLNSFRRIGDSFSEMSMDGDCVFTPVAEFTTDGTEIVLCEILGNIHENPELLEAK
jgi:uncharacterized phage protein (TIGR01671 family)